MISSIFTELQLFQQLLLLIFRHFFYNLIVNYMNVVKNKH